MDCRAHRSGERSAPVRARLDRTVNGDRAGGPSASVGWRRFPEALDLFVRGHTFRAAAPVAAVVGTLLSVVNQGAVLLDGHFTVPVALRVLFNYLTPFTVASIGWLSACRVADEGSGREHGG